MVPVMSVGACLGRAFGELLRDAGVSQIMSPAAFAVVGACSMSAGTTHAISSAVLLIELTNAVTLLPGVVIGVFGAIGVANKLSCSIFDSLALAANLPYFPVPSSLSLRKVVGDVMNKEAVHTSVDATAEDLMAVCCLAGFVFFRINILSVFLTNIFLFMIVFCSFCFISLSR